MNCLEEMLLKWQDGSLSSDEQRELNALLARPEAREPLVAAGRDTAAAGINYRWNDKLTLRTGLQFDQTPISSSKYRHPGLADNDRWMASFGLGYQIDKHTSVDLAYSYLWIAPGDANFHEPCTGTYYEGSAEQGASAFTSALETLK